MTKRYTVAQLEEIEPIACSCGQTRRAFVSSENPVATVHLLDSKGDAHSHYHKKHTEIYLVLSGEGHLELDGEMVPVKPMTAVLIQPLCRHRAVGRMRIINIPIPAYERGDSWSD